MKHLGHYPDFRIHSASSDAFGPKIVSADNLPGTPMDHRSSMVDDLNRTPAAADLDVPRFSNSGVGGGSSTKLVVKNELNERRMSLDYVNRPPSPSHFIQYQAINNDSTFLEDSPATSPVKEQQNYQHHQSFNANSIKNGINGEKRRGSSIHSGPEGLNNGIIQQSPNSNVHLLGGKNGRNKDVDKEVSSCQPRTPLLALNDLNWLVHLQLDPESVMFRDGRRKIDMILCYEEESEGVMTEIEARRREQRKIFQENLVKEGLDIELEDKSNAFDEKTYFVKIHIPWRTETRIAEVMNIKLPVKQFITISVKAWVSGSGGIGV